MLGRPSRVAVPIPALPAGPPLRPCSLGRAPQGSRLGPVGSFVDDLKPNRVLYGVRAALLQRSLEIQPAFFTIRRRRLSVFFCRRCCLFRILLFQFFFLSFYMRAVRPPEPFELGKNDLEQTFYVGISQPIRAGQGRPPAIARLAPDQSIPSRPFG